MWKQVEKDSIDHIQREGRKHTDPALRLERRRSSSASPNVNSTESNSALFSEFVTALHENLREFELRTNHNDSSPLKAKKSRKPSESQTSSNLSSSPVQENRNRLTWTPLIYFNSEACISVQEQEKLHSWISDTIVNMDIDSPISLQHATESSISVLVSNSFLVPFSYPDSDREMEKIFDYEELWTASASILHVNGFASRNTIVSFIREHTRTYDFSNYFEI